MTLTSRPRVVILGAGFGGLWAARDLARSPVEVLVVDRNNYHTFLPLLYQVAAAELEPEDIAYPIRSILRKSSNTGFLMVEVTGIDFDGRVVETEDSSLTYDYLILALGSTSHFFGVPGAAEHAFSLKTVEQAVALRNHLLCCFEHAMHEPDAKRCKQMLTFAIVGGGPTGVEFAGALAELIHGPLVKDYPTLDFRDVRVVLVEASDNLLQGFPDCCRAYTRKRLQRMGVEVLLHTQVSQVTQEAIRLQNGTTIPTETVVWTAGVRSEPMTEAWGIPKGRGGRLAVLPTLQVDGHPEVYVVGDLAYLEEDGSPLPMLAPVAVQQGSTAAQNIERQIAGQAPLPFRYQDRGTMLTIGRNTAVARVWGLSFTGFPAWMLWLGVHIFNLIGFRNRVFVLINWAWDYFFYERTVRLILPAGCG